MAAAELAGGEASSTKEAALEAAVREDKEKDADFSQSLK